MRPHPRHVALLLPWLALACDNGGEKHPCDAGTPTCESSLVVVVPSNDVAFNLTIDDGEGLVATIQCPEPATGPGNEIEGYTVTCGSSQVTIETTGFFGDEVTVQLEQGAPETFTPDYQKGGDFCGNPCTIGTIDL
jgi:hypothetical protein